jgi:chromosome partitioning protein
MRKIAVALSKGGVGKSTTAVNLAAGLARAGSKVLLIDTDTQGQVSPMLGVQPRAGLSELVLGDVTPEEALVEARPGLWVLAGGKSLGGLKRLIARKDVGGEHTLAEALSPFDGRYDYAILDTGPGWDSLTVTVLFYAEELLSPVSLEALAVMGLGEFTKSVEEVQRYRQGLALTYVVPTFYDRRVKKTEELLQQIQSYYGQLLCPPIRYSVRLSEAPGFGQTIFEYAPGSPGAVDYQKLTERIAQNGNP